MKYEVLIILKSISCRKLLDIIILLQSLAKLCICEYTFQETQDKVRHFVSTINLHTENFEFLS